MDDRDVREGPRPERMAVSHVDPTFGRQSRMADAVRTPEMVEPIPLAERAGRSDLLDDLQPVSEAENQDSGVVAFDRRGQLGHTMLRAQLESEVIILHVGRLNSGHGGKPFDRAFGLSPRVIGTAKANPGDEALAPGGTVEGDAGSIGTPRAEDVEHGQNRLPEVPLGGFLLE